jgi:hypothetical protein
VLEAVARFYEGCLQLPMSAGLANFLLLGSGETSFASETIIGQSGRVDAYGLPITWRIE